jgi:hypothetical protein
MANYDFSMEAADRYFAAGNHPMAAAWKACNSKERPGYLAQAVRDYCAFTRCDITELEAQTAPYPPRMDYAVFERALYIMLNSGATADGNMSGPKYFGVPVDASRSVKGTAPSKPAERSEAEQRWWPIEVHVTLEGM